MHTIKRNSYYIKLLVIGAVSIFLLETIIINEALKAIGI